MTAAASPGDRPLTLALVGYALLGALLMSVSARLWWQTPMVLTKYEFDFFVGALAGPDGALSEEARSFGRLFHLWGFALVGALYLFIVTRLVRQPDALQPRSAVSWVLLVMAVFAAGMPYLSPDVFFYLGTSWVEAHHGLSPYRVPMNAVPGFAQDEMFANVFPGFVGGTTSYGPLFQKLAAGLAWLSGGQEKLALALHKLLYAGLHVAATLLVFKLAPPAMARVAALSYALNPVILFSVLTAAHNDHLLNVFVLLALWALKEGRWLASGLALGAAFSFKYFPLVFLPILAAAALFGGERRAVGRRIVDAAVLVFGFVAVAALAHAMYPESLPQFGHTASGGIGVYRNSVYHFIDFWTLFLLPEVFGLKTPLIHYPALATPTRLVYIALYALLMVLYIPRLRRDTVYAAVEMCLVATLMYFLIVNTTNMEWYLTWLMGFAFVLPGADARALGWRLGAYFLPLVIYTVYGLRLTQLLANTALYAVLLVVAGVYLLQLLLRPRALAPA